MTNLNNFSPFLKGLLCAVCLKNSLAVAFADVLELCPVDGVPWVVYHFWDIIHL